MCLARVQASGFRVQDLSDNVEAEILNPEPLVFYRPVVFLGGSACRESPAGDTMT
jgi:hypothetical protein